MDFKVNSSDLLKAISHIHGVVEIRHTLPILSNLIITAKDGYLKLCSTNLDIYCSDQVVADVVSPGEISVSASTLVNALKSVDFPTFGNPTIPNSNDMTTVET